MSKMKSWAMEQAALEFTTQGHRYESYPQREARDWQQWLGDDPGYWQWLKQLEAERADDAGRRADEMIDAGLNPF